MDNIWGKCKARFPRATAPATTVDPETGYLTLKKIELWINTFTPIVTYLYHCNTDITSLSSGTAIKGVVLYISDYIMKTSLKTHTIFKSIQFVFHKNTEMLGGSLPMKEKARRIMTKVVNLLSAKMEMGSPMICMYLLGNPDHYTDHTFIPFYWQSFVAKAQQPFDSQNLEPPHKVTLVQKRRKIIGISPVFDYMYHSPALHYMCLYEWITCCTQVKISKKKLKESKKDELPIEIDVSFETQNDLFKHANTSFQSETNVDEVLLESSKNSKSDTPLGKNIYPFSMDHPLCDTHALHFVQVGEKVIPNFIGATLPCRDQGDQEYYCSTMLALSNPGVLERI